MPAGLKIDIRVLGDKRLARKLDALPAKLQRQGMRKTMRPAAKPIHAAVRSAAPRRTGKLWRWLRLRALPRSRRFIGLMITMPTREQLGITGKQGFYPASHEYGWTLPNGTHVPAKSYIRAPVNAGRSRYLASVQRGLVAFTKGALR